jgi:pantoate--beta-alanine ligase
MKILRNINDLIKAINKIHNLGFVPTMGGLHSGHVSLIKQSKKKSKNCIVSIYVNPKQFNNKRDFKNYPRQINQDIKLLKKLKVNFLFMPKTSEIYKKNIKKKYLLKNKEKILCAKYRKGHFEGVLNIMSILVKLINPKHIYLGEKDFQQLHLIKKYIGKNNKTQILSCKTIRDKKFIALSTRNYLLTKNDMNIASYIAKKLSKFKKSLVVNTDIQKKISQIKEEFTHKFNIKIEYLEARNENNLVLYKKNKKFRLFIAYYINKVRLIDNF